MKIAGISLLLMLWLVGGSVAQVGQKGINADGKDFYVGWLYPSYNDQNLNLGTRDPKPFFGVYVLVASYTDNQFTVSYFNDKTGKEVVASSYQIAKRRALIVPVDRTQMRMDGNNFDGDTAQWRAMHITSKKPINVQFFSSGANSGGSYLALPVSALGKEYVVEAYKDNPSGAGGYLSSENSSGYFMVIATFDGTKVTITPNSTTKALHHPGVNCGESSQGIPKPFSITMQRGQCYMVKSEGLDSYCDISGSTVVADKPVAVLGGHENAYTDGSDIGTILVEARDYMVEQMIPVEYWDSAGYFTVPMVDSKNAQGGDGDNVAMFYGKLQNAPANYPDHTTVTLSAPGPVAYTVNPYPDAVALKSGVTSATSAYDNNGAKMHVVQYDQRMQGGAPYPAPSQMSIIPKSCWKSSYLWYVPSNVTPQEVYQGYYITLICDKDDYNNGTLQWAQDGGPLVPIKTAGTVGGMKQIPGFSNLIGMAIKLNAPRAYYATSTIKKPFIIYNYGFRAIDADRDLGDFCSDDHFFGYASPVGFAANTGDSTFFTVTIDTLCAKWDICAKVSGTDSPKIRSISLLSDRDEDLVDKLNSTTGYESYNARFDPKDDPDGNGEVDFSDTLSTHCVRLFVQNPLDSSYAAVLIVDDKGNYVVKELSFKALAIANDIKGSDFDLLKSPWGLVNAPLGYHKDSIMYPVTEVGDSHCATIYYFNTGDSLNGTPPVVVTGAKLGGADGSFTMTTSAIKFPVTLHPKGAGPADTLKVTVCFSGKDTVFHLDTMTLSTECYDAPVALFGPGGAPLITATDYDFGPVLVGSSNCTGNSTYGPSKIVVRNVGNLPFTLTDKWVINAIRGGKEFSMDPASAARLPYTLWPAGDAAHPRHDSINLYFCYSPIDNGADSSIINWSTDIAPPFDKQVKSWSYLIGRGIKPGVIWDRKEQHDTTFKDRPIIKRVNLLSNATSNTQVEKVIFRGPDSAEYSVTSNQLAQQPLEGFIMNPGDTIWVDYTFAPNISKPEAVRYLDRHVDLIAVYYTTPDHTKRDTTVIHMTGVVDSLTNEVYSAPKSAETTLHPYLANDKLIIPTPGIDNITEIALYDLLGKKVMQWGGKEIERAQLGLVLPKPNVSSGLYILKIEADRMSASGKVTIVKE